MSSATFRQCWSVVGGLGLGWLSRDDVELRGIEECVDQCLLGSDSGPVWVDVVGEAPALVSGQAKAGGKDPTGPRVSCQLPRSYSDPWRRKYFRWGMVTMGPRSTEGRDVEAGIAFPDAEVAVLGCGGEAAQVQEGSSCLLDVGRVVLGNVGVCFLLARPGEVGDEAQPGVGREVWWAEIDELLPRDLGLDDPIRCGHVAAEFQCHLRQARAGEDGQQPVCRQLAQRMRGEQGGDASDG